MCERVSVCYFDFNADVYMYINREYFGLIMCCVLSFVFVVKLFAKVGLIDFGVLFQVTTQRVKMRLASGCKCSNITLHRFQ